ncbi:MAG: LysE family translocator [Pseudomonadota bacterium]
MDLNVWFAFAVAATLLLMIPGPTVALVASYALGAGRRSAMQTVPGVALGDLTAMSVSLAGAGAILATSATAFTVLKLFGAAYLVWMGIGLWRSAPAGFAQPRALSGRRMFWNSYVVTALNPKGIVFFIAFVPQFVDPNRPILTQFVILTATFVLLAAINAAMWAVLFGEMRDRLGRPGVLRWLTWIGGSCLIAAGCATALARRVA